MVSIQVPQRPKTVCSGLGIALLLTRLIKWSLAFKRDLKIVILKMGAMQLKIKNPKSPYFFKKFFYLFQICSSINKITFDFKLLSKKLAVDAVILSYCSLWLFHFGALDGLRTWSSSSVSHSLSLGSLGPAGALNQNKCLLKQSKLIIKKLIIKKHDNFFKVSTSTVLMSAQLRSSSSLSIWSAQVGVGLTVTLLHTPKIKA